VKEVDENKINLLIINKSDFLSERQRLAWLRYFTEKGVKIVFWSAAISIQEEDEELKKLNNENNFAEEEIETDNSSEITDDDEESRTSEVLNKFTFLIDEKSSEEDNNDNCDFKLINSEPFQKSVETKQEVLSGCNDVDIQKKQTDSLNTDKIKLVGFNDTEGKSNSSDKVSEEEIKNCKILNRIELLEFFETIQQDILDNAISSVTTIGFVGYPNVGKSSTLNAILKGKKVSVSETPGKTKHYQTFILDDGLVICDCPGLVFPSFVSTRGELIINGILPIDQMRDYNEPINLVIRDIPKNVIEMIYGIEIKISNESENKNRLPTAEEVCSAYSSKILIRNYLK
jgi:large subunit GTPase 1